MAFRIYTKTGDKGKTSLIGGTKVPKSHVRINSYGTVDELNANIGMAADLLTNEKSISILREIQDRLFTIGSELATDPQKEVKMSLPKIVEEDILLLEKQIDEMDAQLPPLRSFILPGGHVAVSQLHIARCVCRRAERACVMMQEENEIIDPLIIKYINRLSDYLFELARFSAFELKVPEIVWKARI